MPGEIRFAVRGLFKTPSVTALAVLALALGIGANTALFTILKSVLLRPLPYPEPDRIVKLYETEPELAQAPLTGPDFWDWKARSRSFQYMAVFQPRSANLSSVTPAQRLKAAAVSCEMFQVLGVKPLIGNWLQEKHCVPNSGKAVVLSFGTWQRVFGGYKGIIGQTVQLDGEPHEIAGVMPAEFRFIRQWRLAEQDVFVPFIVPREENQRGSHSMIGVGRLKKGVTAEQAHAELAGIATQLEREHPASNKDIGAKVLAYSEDLTGGTRKPLGVLFGAVTFVLLMACANVANLLLARAAARQRELSIRAAMGASRWHLARLLLTESLLLALAGGAVGFLLALWGVDLLASLEKIPIPRLADSTVDWTVLLYTVAISAATGLVFGLLPVLQAGRAEVSRTLAEGSERSSSAGGARIRQVLVAAQIALAIVLLVGAGLLIKSFMRLMTVDPGFPTENILTMSVELPRTKYATGQQAFQLVNRVLSNVRAVPGVMSAGASQKIPLAGGWNGTIIIEGKPYGEGNMEGPLVEKSHVTAGFLDAVKLPLLNGRLIEERDFDPSAKQPGKQVAVINKAAAERFWPNENPVGKRFSSDRNPPNWFEVVGVVGNARQHLAEKPMPEIFMPSVTPWVTFAIRTQRDPALIAGAARRALHDADRELAAYDVRSMEELVSESGLINRFYMHVLAVFAGVALALAAIGVYGIMSYTVTRRTQEMGVRIALGAGRWDILKTVLSQALMLIGIGIAVGLAGAFTLTRFLKTLLFEISVTDPLTFVLVTALLAFAAVAAALIPARRAASVDPIRSLRYQ